MKQIQFDTRNKKPTLYGLLIPVAVTALVIFILGIIKPAGYAVASCIALAALSLCMVGMILHALRGQLEYNPYSYNTIYYTGFALLLLFVFGTLVWLAVKMQAYNGENSPGEILKMMLGTARSYMWMTTPLLVVFSVALCFSNLELIRHESKRPVNFLGILLSVLILVGEALILWYARFPVQSESGRMIRDLITNFASAIYLYCECMLIGTVVANLMVVRHRPERDKDFLIILGCGLRPDGTPTPLLKGRIDGALAFARQQEEENGKKLIFVTSGGQGPGEVCPESTSMKRYLMEQGIPQSRIIEEDRSTSTYENMLYSKAKIEEVNPHGKVAFATTNYHVFRSGLFARRVKMRALGMGVPTKWYFWPNAAVREFVGLLTQHRGKQALILGGMIVLYTVMTYWAYAL